MKLRLAVKVFSSTLEKQKSRTALRPGGFCWNFVAPKPEGLDAVFLGGVFLLFALLALFALLVGLLVLLGGVLSENNGDRGESQASAESEGHQFLHFW